MSKLNILGINGSASPNSSNLAILRIIKEIGQDQFNMTIVDDLTVLPHFRTDLLDQNTPEQIIEFRNQIEKADGIIISTPEYVFSMPSGLKNAIEWCVSETVFSEKTAALITASASGKKGHEELKLIMKTVQACFTDDTTLLIQGVKGKMNSSGQLIDDNTNKKLRTLVQALMKLVKEPAGNRSQDDS